MHASSKAQTQLTVWAKIWNRIFAPVSRLVARLSENRRTVRYSLLALNVLLLGAIGVFAVRDSHPSNVLNQAVLASNAAGSPLDQLSSADIAVNVARAAGLAETTGVINQADSVDAALAVTPADTTTVAKQQSVATEFKSREGIQEYKVQEGDTVASIAAKFDITSDSVRWSNDLGRGEPDVGTTLLIPPVNGIVYTVKDGDTPDSLATRYRANKDQIIAYNDIELTGQLKPGQRIIIPGGQPPAPTPTLVSRPIPSAVGAGYYDYGFCTWWAANRRAEIGRPIPGGLGDAWTWDDRARAFGMPVSNTPAVGAVVVTSSYRRPGHVAFVEEVNSDGSVWISEMNSRGQVSKTNSTPAGGWGRVDWKLIPAGTASSYSYIH